MIPHILREAFPFWRGTILFSAHGHGDASMSSRIVPFSFGDGWRLERRLQGDERLGSGRGLGNV